MDKKIIEENGVKYEVKQAPVPSYGVRCILCDASYYYNECCRIRKYDCKFDEIVKLVDKDKMIDKGKIISYNNGEKYIAVNGECTQCAFYTASKCTLQGFACKGKSIYLMKIEKGGI